MQWENLPSRVFSTVADFMPKMKILHQNYVKSCHSTYQSMQKFERDSIKRFELEKNENFNMWF